MQFRCINIQILVILQNLNYCHCQRGQQMHTILEKKQFSEEVFYLRVTAPEIARNRKAGQFVLVQIDTEFGERIPLTIADADAKEGWIALVFQSVGATTHKLALKNVGEKFRQF